MNRTILPTCLLATLILTACPGTSSPPGGDLPGDGGADLLVTDGGGDAAGGDAVGETSGDADAAAVDVDVPTDVGPLLPAPSLATPVAFTPFETWGNVLIQPSGAWSLDGSVLGIAFSGRVTDGDLSIWFGTVDAAGVELTAPIDVSDVAGLQNEPSVCARPGGGFVVVWSRDTQGVGPDGENLEVRFRLVDASGAAVGAGSTRVLTDRPGNHWLGEVACAGDGGFAVAGVRPDDTTPAFSVFTQRFDALGQALGEPTDLLDGSDGGQVFPDVAWTAAGATFTAWEDTANLGTPTEATVIAVRATMADGTFGPLVVPFSAGVPMMSAAVATHRASGAAIVAGAREGSGVSVAHLAGPTAATATPITLPSGGAAPKYAPVLAGTPHADATFLLYFAGTGSAVTPTLLRVSAAGVEEGPVELATGQFSPYMPSLTYGGGRVTALWTESLGGGLYRVRAVGFGPE